MGRPKGSSPHSYELIYTRLLKGPLWLEDWRSTGLKSRSTVHKCLKNLLTKGLVILRREGHRILYEIAPTRQGNGKVSAWYDLMVSKEEIRKRRREFKREVKELMKMEKKRYDILSYVGKILEREDKNLEDPRNQELYEALRKAGIDWEEIPIPKLILLIGLSKQLCLDCMSKRDIVFLITDHETGEVICPKDGIIVREENLMS